MSDKRFWSPEEIVGYLSFAATCFPWLLAPWGRVLLFSTGVAAFWYHKADESRKFAGTATVLVVGTTISIAMAVHESSDARRPMAAVAPAQMPPPIDAPATERTATTPEPVTPVPVQDRSPEVASVEQPRPVVRRAPAAPISSRKASIPPSKASVYAHPTIQVENGSAIDNVVYIYRYVNEGTEVAEDVADIRSRAFVLPIELAAELERKMVGELEPELRGLLAGYPPQWNDLRPGNKDGRQTEQKRQSVPLGSADRVRSGTHRVYVMSILQWTYNSQRYESTFCQFYQFGLPTGYCELFNDRDQPIDMPENYQSPRSP